MANSIEIDFYREQDAEVEEGYFCYNKSIILSKVAQEGERVLN